MRQITRKIILLSLILAVFGKLVLPDEYYAEDTLIHVPFIKLRQDNNLYKLDYLRSAQNPQQFTIFYNIVSSLDAIFPGDLKLTMEALHLLYLFFFILLVFLLINKAEQTLFVGLILTLLILARFHIGGAAVLSVESEFAPRGLSFVLGMGAGYYWVCHKKAAALLLLILSTVVHPLSVFYGLLLCVGWMTLRIVRAYPRIIIGLLVLTAFIFARINLIEPVNYEWLSILRLRNSYAFTDLWSIKAWSNLVVLLLPGFLFLHSRVKTHKLIYDLVTVTYGISSLALLLNYLYGVMHPLWTVIVLQLGRISMFAVYVSFFAVSIKISSLIKQTRLKTLFLATLALLVIINNSRGQTYAQKMAITQWTDVQMWSLANTSSDCIFLVPFYSSGFRSVSERTITGDLKDGALSFYSYEFAKEWKTRLEELGAWDNLNDDELTRLHTKYLFDYIVDTSSQRRFLKLFDSGKYTIYEYPGQTCKKI